MTYIEFYDNTEAENIAACLAYKPDRVILVGPNIDLLNDRVKRYQELLGGRGTPPRIIPRCVNKNKLKNVVDAFSDLVETYEDCAFDLTGGEDLYLTAIGIVSERYSARNIQLHRFNFQNGSVYDCDLDGVNLLEMEQPKLSVKENVMLYGGSVVYEDKQAGTTPIWDMNPELVEDIRAMWSICSDPTRKKSEQEWNAQMNTLSEANSMMPKDGDPLFVRVNVHTLRNRLQSADTDFVYIPEILDALRDKGLLQRYYYDGDTLELVYKDLQVKRILSKAGQLLEMAIYVAARETMDGEEPVYQDVVNGVCIDWDGNIKPKNKDTRNEIDVLMMHGMIPVFVSCKNGTVLTEELYKLNTVAQYFGGHYAMKVLVAPALHYLGNGAQIKERAEELNIRVVDDLRHKSWNELRRIVRSFWCNK